MPKFLWNVLKISGGANTPNTSPGCAPVSGLASGGAKGASVYRKVLICQNVGKIFKILTKKLRHFQQYHEVILSCELVYK